MYENLVIVESPAKAKTIEKFLGKEFKVMSSYGHIRDLKKKEISIESDTLEPDYEIPADKQRVVRDLRANADKAKKIWLASDEDREGEAISWHLCEVLGLDEENTARIVFHEITPNAILKAIENPRHIDMNLVNAQQARRVLDRLVGFRLSPVLWRKVKPSLSAGRVQSVAVRLIVEREREIQQFVSEPYYRVSALFTAVNAENGEPVTVKADLNTHFRTHDEAIAFLERCKNAEFFVENVSKKPMKRSPAPPFTTSTLQQEAARKLGFTVSQTMMVAQHLYENGHITYMRTDSVNLSGLAITTSKNEIVNLYGEEYSRVRKFHTSSKGAQEAHEAIRPTYMDKPTIQGTLQERRLYDLIWKRTIACQMADASVEKTTIDLGIRYDGQKTDESLKFIAQGEVVLFDGFLKVYRESSDDEDNAAEESTSVLPAMNRGDIVERKEISAMQRFSQPPLRFTEASLVKKLEELGIGRPSTTATIISTIQQRGYVQKGDKKGDTHPYTIDTLKGQKIDTREKKEVVGNEKGKLIPTDIGIVVNDFLMDNFSEIMDYNFTANVEQKFDQIAKGKTEWKAWMREFDRGFEPEVDKVLNARSEHKVGERQLGIDPKTGRTVYVKIGRFGPVVQIGEAGDEEKPLFAQLPADKSMDDITLDEAMELFRLPLTVGEFEGKPVVIGTGRFGPYIMHDKKFVSLPKKENPLTVSCERAVELILQKREEEGQRHIKSFDEDAKMQVLNGRYGPYISYDGKNYRLPKNMHSKAAELSYDECMAVVKNTPVKKK